jgi:hypothetical protein
LEPALANIRLQHGSGEVHVGLVSHLGARKQPLTGGLRDHGDGTRDEDDPDAFVCLKPLSESRVLVD